MIATAVIFGWLWIRADRTAEQRLVSQRQTVATSTEEALGQVSDKLVALAGLFRASETVTHEEFGQFVADIGWSPGMEGIGFVIRTPGNDLPDLERQMSAELGRKVSVFMIGPSQAAEPVVPRDHHFVLRFLSAPSADWAGFAGYDLRSEPAIDASLEAAAAGGEVAITSFLELPGQPDADDFIMLFPVIDPSDQELAGFAAALMDSSVLMEANISPGLQPYLTWALSDATGEDLSELDAAVVHIGFGGRDWLLAVQPTDDSPFLADREGAVVVFALGLVASVLAAISVYVSRQLVEAATELETVRALTKAKDRFIASISHELRTPLTGVLGYVAVLEDDDLETSVAERREMLRSVSKGANELAHIIDDLLVAARAEIGEISITTAPVSLRAAIHDVVHSTDVELGAGFEVEGDSGDMAIADPIRLRQIVRNLLENAHKYGGDRLRVAVSSEGVGIHLEVMDNGRGIPTAVAHAVFEPYRRFNTIIGVTETLGLGLSVARQLAILMNGDLSYSRRDGWTVFTLTLPAVGTTAELRDLPVHQTAFTVIKPSGQNVA